MSSRAILERLFSPGTTAASLAGRYYVEGSEPLMLPDNPFTIWSENATIVFEGGGGLVGRYRGFYDQMPLTIKGRLQLATVGNGEGTALDLAFPKGGAVNEPTALIENILIRPEPTRAEGVGWRCGLRAHNAWNMRLANPFIHGNNWEWHPRDPFLMKAAIHLTGESQDANITGAHIHGGVDTAILSEATAPGECEGLKIIGGEIVGARYGIKALSNMPGGWPTPHIVVLGMHIYYHEVGCLLVRRSEAQIAANFYASAQSKYGVGCFIAGGSRGAQVEHCTFGTMSADDGYGLVVDASEYASIVGNGFSTDLGMWLTPSSAYCEGGPNTFEFCKVPVVDHGRENAVPAGRRRFTGRQFRAREIEEINSTVLARLRAAV